MENCTSHDRARGQWHLSKTVIKRTCVWRSLLLSLFVGLLSATTLTLPGFSVQAQAQRLIQVGTSKRTITVGVAISKSEDIRTDSSFSDVMISDPEIADVNPLTDRSISILGKKIGTTRVSLYTAEKKLIGIFDVEVSYDTSELSAELKRRFPGAKLKVSTVNGRILLSGTAPDGIVLDGALQVARQFGPEIINSVQVAAPQQVLLEVRFIEASRQAGRALGLQWNAGNGHFITNVGAEKPAALLPTASISSAGLLGTATPPFGFLAANLINNGLQVEVAINALEERGLARRLAEPNLVALSGDTANFLAGGEYPIPLSSALGQISVEYKKYGVSLAFTPTVLSNGQINLKIEPEVSQLDPSHNVTGAGITLPAITVRRASSTLELKDGQSFVMAGLLQNDGSTIQHQLPWIGDVPVLGTLFSSKSYQKNETDLIIIVTPHIVRPSRPGDVIRTPFDNTLPANDADFFIKNRAEFLRTEIKGGDARVERPFIGHMLDLSKGDDHVIAQ